jgi:hypothetical protein
MKIIQPIAVWYDGQNEYANLLYVYISYDDLKSVAVLQYELRTDGTLTTGAHTLALVAGSTQIGGLDYTNWGATGDPNAEAYQYLANKLNLTITGDYTPPVIEVPDTENG